MPSFGWMSKQGTALDFPLTDDDFRGPDFHVPGCFRPVPPSLCEPESGGSGCPVHNDDFRAAAFHTAAAEKRQEKPCGPHLMQECGYGKE